MPNLVFLTIHDNGRFRGMLKAVPGQPSVVLKANAGFTYALHAAQGGALNAPLRARRQGDDLALRRLDSPDHALFLIQGFFQVHQDFSGLITDGEGQALRSESGDLSRYLPLLKSGDEIMLPAVGAAHSWQGLGAAAVQTALALSTPSDTTASAPTLAAPSLASFADTDGDGLVNVSGTGQANAVLRIAAPEGSTFTIHLNAAGQFDAEIALTQLSVSLGQYRLSLHGDGGSSSAELIWQANDLTAPQWGIAGADGVPGLQESSGLAALRLRAEGVADASEEALWLGGQRIVWDGSVSSGVAEIANTQWLWRWQDGQLSLSTGVEISLAQLTQLWLATRWDAFGVQPSLSDRTLVWTAVDLAGNVSLPWPETVHAAIAVLALDLNRDAAIGYTQAALDLNADGLIDGATTLAAADGLLVFEHGAVAPVSGVEWGNFSTEETASARLGLAAMIDGNGDALLDARDVLFPHLSVWQDANKNARVDAGEVFGLAAHGIAAVDLNSQVRDRMATPWVSELTQGSAALTAGGSLLWVELALTHAYAVAV